jgi:hypothetical protein
MPELLLADSIFEITGFDWLPGMGLHWRRSRRRVSPVGLRER